MISKYREVAALIKGEFDVWNFAIVLNNGRPPLIHSDRYSQAQLYMFKFPKLHKL
jgi:hypothetical protein